MKPEEIQKLLGGYATGTLTPEEQQALFEAALDDQELFDSLAKEQPLRDLLRDPAARAHVLAAMEDRPRPWWQRANRWVLAGATVAACLAAAAGIYFSRPKPAARPVLVAEMKAPELPRPSLVPAARPPAPLPPMKRKAAAVARPITRQFVPPQPVLTPQPKAEVSTAALVAPPLPAARPPAPPPPPPPPPASAQTVEVTTATPVIANTAPPDNNARTLFYGRSQFLAGQGGPSQVQLGQQLGAQGRAIQSFAVPNLGVKWTALRKQPDGLFSEVDPEQIKAGDTIKLRLVPNDNGYLSVMEGTRLVVPERRVERLQPFETPELTGGAGKRELVVVLARQQKAGIIRTVAAGGQVSLADQSEHAVYEVNTGANLFAPVLVKITLNYQ